MFATMTAIAIAIALLMVSGLLLSHRVLTLHGLLGRPVSATGLDIIEFAAGLAAVTLVAASAAMVI